MNTTIAYITFRGMLGRRRALLLLVLPVILLLLAVTLTATGYNDLNASTAVLHRFALGALLPLLALIAGTGVIAPEIDDGQIMYILTKPIPRPVITTTKLLVAMALVVVFAVAPTLLAGLIMAETEVRTELAFAFTVGVFVGGMAYSAVFVALAVVSRFAVTIGLLYALVWEVLIGNVAPGARKLSILQWATSVTDSLTSVTSVTSEVSLGVAVALLITVTVGGAALAAVRLRTLPITGSD
ncbi:MAG TPA: ABC transporter permease [Streptosporangiaceae bacterium]|nr:ABC transporter permease [Streptosporangiaceae bacterium]